MKIIRESEYNPSTDCKVCTTTYICETLKEYRTCKAVLARSNYRFLELLGDKGGKTTLNIKFYNGYNDRYEHKKCYVKLYMVDYMED